MASYLLQADGSNACCTCPDRDSPCDDCGEPSCALPDGDCPHALCVTFKLDADDTSGSDIVELYGFGTTFDGFGFYLNGSDWNLYGFWDGDFYLAATDPFETWHTLMVQMTDNGDGTIHVDWSVDGIAGESGDMTWHACTHAVELDIGAIFDTGHRTFSNITLLGNPDNSETDWSFPDDALDDFTAGAGIDGDGNLRVDDSSGDGAYATHFSNLKIICEGDCACCDRDLDEISAIDVTLSITADFHDGTCGTGTRSDSFTWNFTRIDKSDSFTPGEFQFKLYLDTLSGGCCPLVFVPSASVYAHDWGKVGDICATGDFRFPDFDVSFDEDCCTGTVDLTAGSVIGLVSATYKSGGDDCADAPCGDVNCDTGFSDLATGIPITSGDFSGLVGSYTLSNTCSITEADLTVTVDLVIS